MNASDITRSKLGAGSFVGFKTLLDRQNGCRSAYGVCSGPCNTSYSTFTSNCNFPSTCCVKYVSYLYENNVNNGLYVCGYKKDSIYTTSNQTPIVCPQYNITTPIQYPSIC